MELEDYTGIKELFAEPDPLVSLQPASTPAEREVNTFMHTEESPVGCEDTKDFVEPDEDLSNFQCREISPPDPEIQRFREPLGILPSCLPPPIENDREDGRKVRNVIAHLPKLVGVKERVI